MARGLLPVAQAVRVGDQPGLVRRQAQAGFAQAQPLRIVAGRCRRIVQHEQGRVAAQPQQARFRICGHLRRGERVQAIVVRGRALLRIEHHETRARRAALRGQPFGIVAMFGRAFQSRGGEGVAMRARGGALARRVHTVNEEPQPQVVFALGLRMTKRAPDNDSE